MDELGNRLRLYPRCGTYLAPASIRRCPLSVVVTCSRRLGGGPGADDSLRCSFHVGLVYRACELGDLGVPAASVLVDPRIHHEHDRTSAWDRRVRRRAVYSSGRAFTP